VDAHRVTATVVGVLYIVGTVAGVLSVIVTSGLLDAPDAPDYLKTVASHASQARWGALLSLVMGVALAMVPAMMFPLFRRQSEALAIGYVIFRGALETVMYIAVGMCWLLLVAGARQYIDSRADVASQVPGLGALIVKAMDPIVAIQGILFSLGALMFYYLLYQSRLVPRWLSGWGIVGAVGYLTAGLIAVFSTNLVFLLMPLAVQEMVMAIWLIAKGFNSDVIASEGDRQPIAV
jgi:hypothetical protein